MYRQIYLLAAALACSAQTWRFASWQWNVHNLVEGSLPCSDVLTVHIRQQNGDEEAALQLIIEAQSSGGAARQVMLVDDSQAPASAMKPVADVCKRYLCSC